jgi:hypothetical protein
MSSFDVWQRVETITGASTAEELVSKNPTQHRILQEIVQGILDNNDDLVIDLGLSGLKQEEMVEQLILMLATRLAFITGTTEGEKVHFSFRFNGPAIGKIVEAVQKEKEND